MLAECKLEVREVKESVSHEFSESYRKLYEHEESSRPAECAILSPKSENQLWSRNNDGVRAQFMKVNYKLFWTAE